MTLLSIIIMLLCGRASAIEYLVLHRYMDDACTQPIGYDQMYYWSSRECWADLNLWEQANGMKHNTIFWTGYDADGVEQCQNIAVGNVQRVYCRTSLPVVYQCKKVPLNTCVPNWLRLDTHMGPLDQTGAPVGWIKWRVVDINPATWYTVMHYPDLGTGGCDRATRYRILNTDGSIFGDEMGFGYSTITRKPFSPPRLLFNAQRPVNETCVDEPCSEVTCTGTGGCSVPSNVNVTVHPKCNWRSVTLGISSVSFCRNRPYQDFNGCEQRDPSCFTSVASINTLGDCEFLGHLGTRSTRDGALYIQPRSTNPFDARFPMVPPTSTPPPPTPIPTAAPTPGPTTNATSAGVTTVPVAISCVMAVIASILTA